MLFEVSTSSIKTSFLSTNESENVGIANLFSNSKHVYSEITRLGISYFRLPKKGKVVE